MGYYIEGPAFGKALHIKSMYKGQILLDAPKKFSDVPKDKAIIVVVENPLFEAAGYAFSEDEFKHFTDKTDTRRKLFVLMDKELAERLSGKKERNI